MTESIKYRKKKNDISELRFLRVALTNAAVCIWKHVRGVQLRNKLDV